MQTTKKFSKRRTIFSRNHTIKLSEFERAVYKTVRKIPRGKVATYAQIADMLNKPRAVRAVGSALNKNKFSDVPCHRVIRSDGMAGGYAWGSAKKIKSLRSEGMKITNNRVNLIFYGIKHNS